MLGNIRKRIHNSTQMKNTGENEVHRENTIESTLAPSVFQVYPGLTTENSLRRRYTSSESVRKSENVTYGRVKTNIIYLLALVIVGLVAALCYTLILLFEETNDVFESPIDDIPESDLPFEQHTWYKSGIDELRQSVNYDRNHRKAKNVILFMGDGMGVATVTATRIYKHGEEGILSWESFPHVGLLKVNIRFT